MLLWLYLRHKRHTDDAKVYSTITCDSDHLHLQKVIDHIKEWCDQWLLPLNINKCSHLSYTSRLSIDTAYHINNTDSVSNIQNVDQIKDLLHDSHLTFKDHIQEKLIKHILWLDWLKETSFIWILEPSSCFTKHWSCWVR